MKQSKLLLVAVMILPFFTLPLLGRKTFKRFLPTALFMSGLLLGEGYIARKYDWWTFYKRIFPPLNGLIPFIVGPFFVGTLWILKFTYGKFIRFIIVNLITDSVFTYIMVDVLRKLRIGELLRINKFQLSTLFLFKSLLLYGVQFLLERLKWVMGNGNKLNGVLKKILQF
jgi:hypothetical protein